MKKLLVCVAALGFLTAERASADYVLIKINLNQLNFIPGGELTMPGQMAGGAGAGPFMQHCGFPRGMGFRAGARQFAVFETVNRHGVRPGRARAGLVRFQGVRFGPGQTRLAPNDRELVLGFKC